MAFGTFTWIALSSLFKRPATTRWPATPYVPVAGARGSLRFSTETCTYCSLCALKCPTGAISVDRVKKAWVFDRFKCIVCAACVDACQKGALLSDPDFAAPSSEHIIELYRVEQESDACPHPAEGEA